MSHDQKITRNYTSTAEQWDWLSLKRRERDYKWLYRYEHWQERNISKQVFRQRRDCWGLSYLLRSRPTNALRTSVGTNDEIGIFMRLTNSYLILSAEEEANNFSLTASGDFPDLPTIRSSLGSCRVVGCICVGNQKGLVVPDIVSDLELKQLKEELPDSVVVKQISENLSAIGNVVACNDRVALIHPELDKESEEKISDTLQVEAFRSMLHDNPLVGSYSILNNNGGLISGNVDEDSLQSLSSLLDLPLHKGTVNRGGQNIASGLVVNDNIAYAGMRTTAAELSVVEQAFQLR